MDIFPATAHYSEYFITNLSASILTLAVLLFFYMFRRYMFVKPSLMILACYHVLAQWPLVLLSTFAERFLLSPWIFAGLVHGFVLIGLAIAAFDFNRSAKTVWDKLSADTKSETPREPLWIILGMILILTIIYFAYVPLEQTGLYALIASPEHAVAARELSLKLLSSSVPKYSLTLIGNVLTPLLTTAVLHFVLLNRKSSIITKLLWVVLLFVCWMLSILSGAKAIWSYLIIASLAVIAWRARLRIPAVWVVGGLAATLAPAFLIFMLFASVDQAPECAPPTKQATVENATSTDLPKNGADQSSPPSQNVPDQNLDTSPLDSKNLPPPDPRIALCAVRLNFSRSENKAAERIAAHSSGKELSASSLEQNQPKESCNPKTAMPAHENISSFRSMYVQAIETNKRAFVVPMIVATWFADYAQRNEPIGIAGIARFAQLSGIDPIDLPNRIGLIYAPCYYGHEVIESISATTGFLFAQYGYFGFLALPLALLGLILCDAILLILRTLPNVWIVPILSFVSLDALKFTQSDYLTIWITHGLAINLFLVAIFARWDTFRKRQVSTT